VAPRRVMRGRLLGAFPRLIHSWVERLGRLVAVHGAADVVTPFETSQLLFDDAPSPKYLVRAPGDHITPFTIDPIVRPAVSTLVADFLLAELDGDTQARQRVPTDANAGSLQLVGSG
jgi:fermentation-respiration switch protein FrsA (DUF1100 family)